MSSHRISNGSNNVKYRKSIEKQRQKQKQNADIGVAGKEDWWQIHPIPIPLAGVAIETASDLPIRTFPVFSSCQFINIIQVST